MKSTQDLNMFMKELSDVIGAELAITVYNSKDFAITKFDEEQTGEVIYSSMEDPLEIDINDLCYEDAAKFAEYIEVNNQPMPPGAIQL